MQCPGVRTSSGTAASPGTEWERRRTPSTVAAWSHVSTGVSLAPVLSDVFVVVVSRASGCEVASHWDADEHSSVPGEQSWCPPLCPECGHLCLSGAMFWGALILMPPPAELGSALEDAFE